MPAGWPEPPHVETDESAFTGRTAPLPTQNLSGRIVPCYVLLGIPILTAARRKIVKVAVSDLVPALAWLRRNAV